MSISASAPCDPEKDELFQPDTERFCWSALKKYNTYYRPDRQFAFLHVYSDSVCSSNPCDPNQNRLNALHMSGSPGAEVSDQNLSSP